MEKRDLSGQSPLRGRPGVYDANSASGFGHESFYGLADVQSRLGLSPHLGSFGGTVVTPLGLDSTSGMMTSAELGALTGQGVTSMPGLRQAWWSHPMAHSQDRYTSDNRWSMATQDSVIPTDNFSFRSGAYYPAVGNTIPAMGSSPSVLPQQQQMPGPSTHGALSYSYMPLTQTKLAKDDSSWAFKGGIVSLQGTMDTPGYSPCRESAWDGIQGSSTLAAYPSCADGGGFGGMNPIVALNASSSYGQGHFMGCLDQQPSLVDNPYESFNISDIHHKSVMPMVLPSSQISEQVPVVSHTSFSQAVSCRFSQKHTGNSRTLASGSGTPENPVEPPAPERAFSIQPFSRTGQTEEKTPGIKVLQPPPSLISVPEFPSASAHKISPVEVCLHTSSDAVTADSIEAVLPGWSSVQVGMTINDVDLHLMEPSGSSSLRTAPPSPPVVPENSSEHIVMEVCAQVEPAPIPPSSQVVSVPTSRGKPTLLQPSYEDLPWKEQASAESLPSDHSMDALSADETSLSASESDGDDSESAGSTCDLKSADDAGRTSSTDADITQETSHSGGGTQDHSVASQRSPGHQVKDKRARKRSKLFDEDALGKPLQQGFTRQIKIKSHAISTGLRGDVFYYAPCGKKLRTYPEIRRFLDRSGITTLSSENFSFSAKLRLGDYMRYDAEMGALVPLDKDEIELRAKHENSPGRAGRPPNKLKKRAAEHKASKPTKREKAEQRKLVKERIRTQKIMYKEMRKQQINEERERRKEELNRLRLLEAQKKAEEKARMKVERNIQKNVLKKHKTEQRYREKSMIRESRKPLDDLVFREGKNLPNYKCLKSFGLPGSALADLLLVYEFAMCFSSSLELEKEDVPSVLEMILSLVEHRKADSDAILFICTTLLEAAIKNLPDSTTFRVYAGLSLQELELTELSLSEALRTFMGLQEDYKLEEVEKLLGEQLFQCLTPKNKTAVLTYLVNHLLTTETIATSIETNMEHVSNLRKNKWNLEGRIRRLRADLKLKQGEMGPTLLSSGSKPGNSTVEASPAKAWGTKRTRTSGSESEESESDGSGKESNSDNDDEVLEDSLYVDIEDSGEEDPQNVEDLEKKIKCLEKRHSIYRRRIFAGCQNLRGVHLGQDRYKRRYFILPHACGVFVESQESGYYPHSDDSFKLETSPLPVAVHYKPKPQSPAAPSEESSPLLAPTVAATQGKLDLCPAGQCVSPPTSAATDIPDKEIGTYLEVKAEPVPSVDLAIPTSEATAAVGTSCGSGPVTPSQVYPAQPIVSPQMDPNGGGQQNPIPRSSLVWVSILPAAPCYEDNVVPLPTPTRSKEHSDLKIPSFKVLGSDPEFLTSLSVRPTTYGPQVGFKPGGTTPSSLAQLLASSRSALASFPTMSPNTPASSNTRKVTDPFDGEMLKGSMTTARPIPQHFLVGWWKISDPDVVLKLLKSLDSRGIRERQLHKQLSRHIEYAQSSCAKASVAPEEDTEEKMSTENSASDQLSTDESKPQNVAEVVLALETRVLMDVEDLEDNVMVYSLQMKGAIIPSKVSPDLQSDRTTGSSPSCILKSPLETAKTRLLALETMIEPRYIKPPFRDEKPLLLDEESKNQAGPSSHCSNSPNETTTPSLEEWREAVRKSCTASQLVLCVIALNNHVAWDKSINKVYCIVCSKGDNEELLLLCDKCERGCHTYCCVPKLANIPQGDWFCNECKVLSTKKDQCCVCMRDHDGKRAQCDFCPRQFHLGCLNPPLLKMPRSPWKCHSCRKSPRRPRNVIRAKKTARDPPEVEKAEKKTVPTKSKSPLDRSDRKSRNRILAVCRQVLAEMEKHERSWPFLTKVNQKQVPQYYVIIKNPMDFHTMKTKLRDLEYSSKDEFASDARLVFQNCSEFNEDDSEVGIAGRQLSQFFEKRWVELCAMQASRSGEAGGSMLKVSDVYGSDSELDEE